MKSRILKQVHRLGAGLSSPYLKSLMEETSLSEKELRRRAARARTAILHDYSRFSILTNDTFFQRILRGFIKELGIDNKVPIVGLAKRLEEVFYPGDPVPYYLSRTGEPLKVVCHIRDEAHRFAITYHKSLRDKAIRESVLDEVTGIGEAKKMKLLKKFRSVYGIARASAGEIAAAAGVNGTVAAEVLKAVSQLTRKGD